MTFRFVHTADIHLDSPLRSLSLRNPDLAGLIGDATRQALVAIVDLCIDEQVDALVIAGDLYDGDQTSMKTARFLALQMMRLHEAGIKTYTIRGNHDALSRITQELVLPPSVKVYGGRAEAVELEKDGLTIAMHGISFSKPHAPESLLPKYRPPVSDAINIGIMHTSLAGAPGHDVYAPCNILDLHTHGFDYWALGHIHQRTDHKGARSVVMPGMPQGRDINEAGAKTVSLVTVGNDRRVTVEERLTGIAQFERVTVNLDGISEWRDAVGAIGEALHFERGRTLSSHLVARLRLTGATPLAWRLRRDGDLALAEAEQRAEQIGRTWIEKLELDVRQPQEAAATSADPVVELGHLMRDDVMARSRFRDEVSQMVKDLLDELPPESRAFAGNDKNDFDAFVNELMLSGADDIIARMKATDREEI
jgi:exonuclease SbcD